MAGDRDGAARRQGKGGRGWLHAQDHFQEEQLPLDLFLASIETLSFIFPEIEIRVRSGRESRR